MARIGRLNVQIGVQLDKFRSDMNSAFKTLNSSTAQMKRSLDSLSGSFKLVAAGAAVLTGALAMGGVTKNIIGVADAFNQLEGKIRNSVDASTSVDAVLKQIVDSSNRTGTSVDTVGQAFARLRPAALELGLTNEELIRFNETFQKMGVLAGATGEEVSQTMIQLSQAIASNRLGGDELRSVLEQMPPVARAIADAMKIPMSQLKDVAKEGKVTADVVLNAVMSKTKEVDEQFSKLPGSVERSMNRVSNSLQLAIADINKTSGATETLSGLLDGLAGVIDTQLKPALSDYIRMIQQMGETAFQMGSFVVNGMMIAVTGVATGIAKVIGIAMQGIENLVGAATSALNQAIGMANRIPGVNMGLLGVQKGSAHKWVDKFAGDMWQNAKMFDDRAGQSWNDIMSGKSVFNGTGSGGMGASNLTKSPYKGVGGGGGKGKKGKSSGKSDAEKELERLKQLAKSLHESVMTVWEKYNKDLAEATLLMNKKLISTEDYTRKVKQLNQELAKTVKVDPGFGDLSEDQRKQVDGGAMSGPWSSVAKSLETIMEPMEAGLKKIEGSYSSFNQQTDEGVALMKSLYTPTEAASAAIDDLVRMLKSGTISQETFSRGLKQVQDDLDATTKNGQDFAVSIGNITAEFGDKFFDTFINGMKTGKIEFKDFIASALEDLAKLMFKLTITIPLADALTSALSGEPRKNKGPNWVGVGMKILGPLLGAFSGGGMTSGFNASPGGGASFLGPMAMPQFAAGGITPINQPFMVGERGPEIMMSGRQHTVIPNHELGGGGGVTLNQYFTIQTIDNRDFEDRLAEHAKFIGNVSVQSVQRLDNRMGRRGVMEPSRG